MPLIEKISQMQKQGLTNEQIIQRLKEEGTSPREINEAITQNQVKSAVSSEGMQPSVMTSPPQIQQSPPSPQPQEPLPTQMPQEQFAQPLTQELAPTSPQYSQEEAYPDYSYQEYQYPTQPLDTEMIAEISEQVVAESIEKLQKQLSETIKFKTETSGKVKDMDERLKRIELTIHTLQTAILRKIGEYGRNIEDLKSEIETTQESFSKVLEPLSEDEGKKSTRKTRKKTETKRGKKKNSFEHYLRR